MPVNTLEVSSLLEGVHPKEREKPQFVAQKMPFPTNKLPFSGMNSVDPGSSQIIGTTCREANGLERNRTSAALILEEMKSQKRAIYQKSSHWGGEDAIALENSIESYGHERRGSLQSQISTHAPLDAEQTGTMELPLNTLLDNLRSEAEATQAKLIASGISEESLKGFSPFDSTHYKPGSQSISAPQPAMAQNSTRSMSNSMVLDNNLSPSQHFYARNVESRPGSMDSEQIASFMLPLPMLPTPMYQPHPYLLPDCSTSAPPHSHGVVPMCNAVPNMQYMAPQQAPSNPYMNGPVLPFAYHSYCHVPVQQGSTTIAKKEIFDLDESQMNRVSSWPGSSQSITLRNYSVTGQAERTYRKRQRKGVKAETYCQQCGATSTPEWRKGPEGSRTLCNACGLFHAKMCRKRGEREALRLLRERQASPRT